MPVEPEPELTSWKAIADYLGVNLRTAQKWELERGLPVRRMPGQKGRVSAFPAELDRWKVAIEARPSWWNNARLLRYYAASVTIVALAALAWAINGGVARIRRGHPALFRADFNRLFVLDEKGRDLWSIAFPEPLASGYYTDNSRQYRIWFGDLDGDSRIETVFDYFPASYAANGTVLYCFSEDGKEIWRFVPGAVVKDLGGATYPRTYVTGQFLVAPAETGKGSVIYLTSRHTVQYVDQVAALDARGKILGEYWHSGHLDYMTTADIDGDGAPELLLAGVNNGYKAATLIVLDPRRVSGASTQEPGSPYQLDGGTGSEKAVILFPRSCINQKLEPYNMARELSFSGSRLEVYVWERLEGPEVVIYYFGNKLKVLDVQPSDHFKALHRKMESDGQLTHKFSDREAEALRDVRFLKSF